MLTIEQSAAFKRDYKKVKASPRYSKDLDKLLVPVLNALVADQDLLASLLDHVLVGNWAGYSECHLKPDLLLIYKKTPQALRLARLGSHSQLFG